MPDQFAQNRKMVIWQQNNQNLFSFFKIEMIKYIKKWNRARLETRHRNRYSLDYLGWVDRSTLRPLDGLNGPLVSIIVPTYNPPPKFLKAAIDSALQQTASNFEICLADDASTDPGSVAQIKGLIRNHKQIKFTERATNGHISAASNEALQLAAGEWVCFLDQDDVLSPAAIEWFNATLNKYPDARIIYSDEDKINSKGVRFDPHFKTDYNPELLLTQNYFCHLTFVRRDLVELAGNFRVGYEGAQDHDLFLRCVEKCTPKQIIHIPRILYHWRSHAGSTALAVGEKPYVVEAVKKTILDALGRRGLKDACISHVGNAKFIVKYPLPVSMPLVSIIIPTRDAKWLVMQAIETVVELTKYPNYEIIIIDNGSTKQESIEYFKQLEDTGVARIICDNRPFNYSQLNNCAAKHAKGDLLLLLNNDIEIASPNWLDELVSLSELTDVGIVGAKLLYPDERMQHAGVVVGMGGVAGHIFAGLDSGDGGYFDRAQRVQDIGAVTGACLLIKKHIYEEVGGLDEADFPVAYNDIDLCLKVREAGYRVLYTPNLKIFHHESATRGDDRSGERLARWRRESAKFKKRWGKYIEADPFYNVNLSLYSDRCAIAETPRTGDGAIGGISSV